MARASDNLGVFDVSKPQQVPPDASGRPIIVGHRPTLSDPMVKDQLSHMAPRPKISVPVMTDEGPVEAPQVAQPPVAPGFEPPQPLQAVVPPQNFAPSAPVAAHPESVPLPPAPEPTMMAAPPAMSPPAAMAQPLPQSVPLPPEARVDPNHLAGNLTVAHPPAADLDGYWRKPLIGLSIVILLIIAYILIATQTTLPLPFNP